MTEILDDTRFYALKAQADALTKELDAMLPDLARARGKYMRSRNDADRRENDRIQEAASRITARISEVTREMKDALAEQLGISVEELEELTSDEQQESVSYANVARGELRAEDVVTTGFLDELLPLAIQNVVTLLPSGWLDDQADLSHRLDGLFAGDACLSLVKGLRPESEVSPLHRLRQMIRVSRDYLDQHPHYDHFAGAALVPQMVQLGSRLSLLDQVGGDVQARLKRLWEAPSEQIDGVVFELLVAMGCVEKGRRVDFIAETAVEKTPDLRCHDPFPMVIECKRRRALSDYELSEEATMREIFELVRSEATPLGINGRFELQLTEEARSLDLHEVARSMIRQRLAAHPERPLEYPWGSVAFRPLPSLVALASATKMYSPDMLQQTFGWDCDLPEWDGIICRADTTDVVVDEARAPLAIVWTNTSDAAVQRRAWSPLDLVGKAMSQIPPGEFGMIYIAYHEGAREAISDSRVDEFMKRLPDWEHSANIRVPLALLVRLYPRPLDHGNPDLIESSLRFVSAEYGDASLLDYFPLSVFTRTAQSLTRI